MTSALAFQPCPAIYHVPIIEGLVAQDILEASDKDLLQEVQSSVKDYPCLLYYGHEGPHRARIDGNTVVW